MSSPRATKNLTVCIEDDRKEQDDVDVFYRFNNDDMGLICQFFTFWEFFRRRQLSKRWLELCKLALGSLRRVYLGPATAKVAAKYCKGIRYLGGECDMQVLKTIISHNKRILHFDLEVGDGNESFLPKLRELERLHFNVGGGVSHQDIALAHPKIRHIHLGTRTVIYDVQALLDCCPQLNSICTTLNGIKLPDVSTQITKLSLVADSPVFRFNYPNLRELDVTTFNIVNFTLDPAVGFPLLKKFSICGMSGRDAINLEALAKSTLLEDLQFERMNFDYIFSSFAQSGVVFPKLSNVSLPHRNLEDQEGYARDLAKIAPNLTEFDGDLSPLETFHSAGLDIQVLDLRFCVFSQPQVEFIARKDVFPNLRELNLRYRDGTDHYQQRSKMFQSKRGCVITGHWEDGYTGHSDDSNTDDYEASADYESSADDESLNFGALNAEDIESSADDEIW